MLPEFELSETEVRVQCLRKAGGDFAEACRVYHSLGPLTDYVSVPCIRCLLQRVRLTRNFNYRHVWWFQQAMAAQGVGSAGIWYDGVRPRQQHAICDVWWDSLRDQYIVPRSAVMASARACLDAPAMGPWRKEIFRHICAEFGFVIPDEESLNKDQKA